jgi:beta-glucosidase
MKLFPAGRRRVVPLAQPVAAGRRVPGRHLGAGPGRGVREGDRGRGARQADAGLDQEMPTAAFYGPALLAAVRSGQVAAATLGQMVTRILTQMFRFDDFNDPPAGSAGATVTTPAHQAVSAAVAEVGTVLLKNAGAVLPLRASGAGTVAVIGPAASAAPADAGGGSAYVTAPFSVTPLQGLRAAAGPGTTVSYTRRVLAP